MALTIVVPAEPNDLDWVEELPEVPRSTTGGAQISEEWKAVAELLASNSYAWLNIAHAEKLAQASALAHRINKGRSRAFEPAGSYEAEARTDGNGGGLVWARYVGENVDPAKTLWEGNTVANLKAMAKDRGLKVSGSGKDLAARIVEHDEAQLSLVD